MADLTYKDYTSLYKIKDFMTNVVAPKYFSFDATEQTSVGLFGYITEILANGIEDSFFSTTMLFKEIFPVTAEDPESIYLMAALFQLDNHFAVPATVPFNILISEEDLLNATEVESNGIKKLHVDRDMSIMVGDKEFMLDYDIEIDSKKNSNDEYTHTARYIYHYEDYYKSNTDSNFNTSAYKNTLSTISSPYIKTRIHNHTENNRRYVLLTLNLRQVSKTSIEDSILDTERINVITKEYKYDGQLANFEMFYRESPNQTWTQMEKYVANSTQQPSYDPYCYYKFIDDNKIQITFNTNDRYFIPAYNSELKIELYTTLGADGNFDDYTDNEVTIGTVAKRYVTNKGLIYIGATGGASMGGYDTKSLEELRTEVIKAFSTVKAFSTANDLTLYFDSLRLNQNNKLLIIKQRDDSLKRLFSSYVLFKDSASNVIPTNTVNVNMPSDIFDRSVDQSNRYIIDAGKLYKFILGSRDTVEELENTTLSSDLDSFENNDYVYVNPFLTVLGRDPVMASYYINTLDDDISVDFETVNEDSFNQFIVNSINIKRNAMLGDKDYTFTVRLIPTTELPLDAFVELPDTPITDDSDVIWDTENKVATYTDTETGITYTDLPYFSIIDDDGMEVFYLDLGVVRGAITFEKVSGFVPLHLTGFDSDAYILTGTITTDDFVSLGRKLKITGGLVAYGMNEEPYFPNRNYMADVYSCTARVHTFLKYGFDETGEKVIYNGSVLPISAGTHSLVNNINDANSGYHELDTAVLTNVYIANKNLNFMIPVPEIISTLNYVDEGETTDNSGDKVQLYSYKLYSVPMVKANVMKSVSDFHAFLNSFRSMYTYLENAMKQLTNNFDIDLKFFNTYGPARHFYAFRNGSQYGSLMDRVNITIRFGVKFNITTAIENAVDELKDYIKSYIENDEVSLITSPSLYISNLITSIKNNFQSISYITFKGVNNRTLDFVFLFTDLVDEENELIIVNDIEDRIEYEIKSGKVSFSGTSYIKDLCNIIQSNYGSYVSYVSIDGYDSDGNTYDESGNGDKVPSQYTLSVELPEVQKFESEVTDVNVLEGNFNTSDVVPEYLNINAILTTTNGTRTKDYQIIIDIL